ncbi:patatin-like phospholipase family protein [Methylobacterium bullatum]|uniref:NTE family protein n=1 Tax=Methylobacterium bullatum TaxID=570505 RepID=A0AAV4Z240_9HYPH|nr:patatin-like phospholipase family protein [Methylobacterium bullatum]GJD37827.1 putative NTE family protein [Methylobacterium bullatum]
MTWDGLSFRGVALYRQGMLSTLSQKPVFPRGNVEPVAEQPPPRPRIGLALGGGSARGWAHIGVIEVLEEAGIHPDMVAGCSIGAVVGGCYAAGKLDLLKDFALSLTRRRVMGLLDLRLGSGLIAGERLKRRLEGDLGTRRVENLPIRFASVATDLGSGDEVWLTRGSLVEAIRASYALPGLFPPVRLDGRLMMDGTLVNPVPVKLARGLGAELVICVNLNGDPRTEPGLVIGPDGDGAASPALPLTTSRRGWNLLNRMRGTGRRVPAPRPAPPREPGPPGMGRVMFDAFNITQDRISRARLERDPPDLMLSPRLAEMGLFEFHRAEEAILLGRDAAKAALPRIRELVALAAERV